MSQRIRICGGQKRVGGAEGGEGERLTTRERQLRRAGREDEKGGGGEEEEKKKDGQW
jgi:hypothetical protein